MKHAWNKLNRYITYLNIITSYSACNYVEFDAKRYDCLTPYVGPQVTTEKLKKNTKVYKRISLIPSWTSEINFIFIEL